MRDEDLVFDRKSHVIYSQECKKAIMGCVARHYPPDEIDAVFTKIQQQYASYLKDYRTDLGGKANFHNGVGGTYDCIAVFSYYAVCKEVTSFQEIEEMYGGLILPAFEKLRFVDANRPIFRLLLYLAFAVSAKKCAKWGDYKVTVHPMRKGEPIRYEFTACPVAEFAREHDMLAILPALCNVDYAAMECLRARLVRTSTCGNGTVCDYAICGDRDSYLKEHEEYRDEQGYRRNR